ncbi:hypothetical protein [Kluyvera cryocrescens]|uniref:hypothetical protein n=1 Tax=Kluyvera cryocrescens TaxID=580 RepID=UPI00248B64C4|nr:hypothetical protein [Kluyvera cryocrescens]
MEKLCKVLKLATAYIVTIIVLVGTLIALKWFEVTTLSALGIIALIITILPGFSVIRSRIKPIKLKNQEIDFWFLSGVAVALVSLPIAIWDDHAFINDRWGYGIVGVILIVLIVIDVYKNRK